MGAWKVAWPYQISSVGPKPPGYSRLPNRLEYSAPQSTPEQSSAACRMSIGDKPSSLCVNSASATAAARATTKTPKILAIITKI